MKKIFRRALGAGLGLLFLAGLAAAEPEWIALDLPSGGLDSAA